jgi:hypothetical protein
MTASSQQAESVEIYRGAHNLTTAHSQEHYPGLLVVVPFEWSYGVIVPQDGQTFTARGGERLIPFRTIRGDVAEGFTLAPGDRATRVRSDLPHAFAEWHVIRSASQPD